jgi:hypothetical protein
MTGEKPFAQGGPPSDKLPEVHGREFGCKLLILKLENDLPGLVEQTRRVETGDLGAFFDRLPPIALFGRESALVDRVCQPACQKSERDNHHQPDENTQEGVLDGTGPHHPCHDQAKQDDKNDTHHCGEFRPPA